MKSGLELVLQEELTGSDTLLAELIESFAPSHVESAAVSAYSGATMHYVGNICNYYVPFTLTLE